MNVDRRFASQHVSLKLLNHAQRTTFDLLAQSGFGLLFIRSTPHGKLAICSSGSELATINEAGQLDTQNEVLIRR